MRKLSKAVPLIAAIFSFCLSGHSQAKEENENLHLRVAYETVFVSRTTRAYNEVLPNLARRAKSRLIDANPDLKGPIEEEVDAVALKLAERQAELDLDIARAWADRFTIEELREISAFFATPTGTKFAKSNTELIAAGLDAARRWGSKMGEELILNVEARLRERGFEIR